MFNWKPSLVIFSVMVTASCGAAGDDIKIGRSPTANELRVLDIDVRADGYGLPKGQGSVSDGEVLYDEHCASCHGTFGEGSGRYPALAGGQGTLFDDRPLKTVGSFWPYAAPLFDYTYRTMPFGNAQSMSVNDTYAIVAYILNLNDLVDEDTVLNKKNLPALVMPNAKGFIKAADKPDTPQIRCMMDCLGEVRIHSRSGALDVTPTTNDEK